MTGLNPLLMLAFPLGFKSESIKLQITDLLAADLQSKTDLNSGSHSLRMHTHRFLGKKIKKSAYERTVCIKGVYCV